MTAGTATTPVLRAMLDHARRKNYTSGVLGVRAQPHWDGQPRFEHQGVSVRVAPCESTLAVREALLEYQDGTWLVVLTDRDDNDLGAGVLSHLVWHRMRTPDPWAAVELRFAASGVDHRLVGSSGSRDLATGLLAAAPADGWPPAPGGVLTREHALGAAARQHLGLGRHDTEIDAVSVLSWTTDEGSAARLADLRTRAGDALTDAVIDWVAGQASSAAGPVQRLLRAGRLADVVPLGVVSGLLIEQQTGSTSEFDSVAHSALIRLESLLGGTPMPSRGELATWGQLASTVTTRLLLETPAHGERVVARADALLGDLQAGALAESSELVRSGLTARLYRLAGIIIAALPDEVATVEQPLVDGAGLTTIERAWARVTEHRLADGDQRTPPFRAVVRLLRWLSGPAASTEPTLPARLARHRDIDAWVDSAVNDAAAGVGDDELGAALHAVLAVARRRRDRHDHEFANALAGHTADPAAAGNVTHLERVLPLAVLPLAGQTPVLLLVLDGCSAAVAAEVMTSVLEHRSEGWAEALLPGHTRRAAALAALPTLTQVSRTSLLCGDLRTGDQSTEQTGFAALARAHGVTGSRLFHRRPLDSTRLGFAVADEVGAAIDDTRGTALVGCVLNTIDDALDRADPAGTDWSPEVVKHLGPLLERALRAGRTVVLTADHGHVIERRDSTQRSHPNLSSTRSRPAGAAGEDEVLVDGPRVLAHSGRAVLAVDERLRYGPLKAGYHGGASPAEAVVPLCVLVPGTVPEGTDLTVAGPQQPAWWNTALPTVPSATDEEPVERPAPTLFDEPDPDVSHTQPSPGMRTASAVVSSKAFAAQRRLAGRGLSVEQAEALLAALLDAPGNRLAPDAAASAAGIPAQRLRGAIVTAQRLLNVEGYPVLRLDVDGQSPILDETLLREQFEVPA